MRLLIGQRDKAVSLLEAARAASPLDPRIANDLAVALQADDGEGDPVIALRAFDLLLQPFGPGRESPWLHYNRALAYRRAGLLWEAKSTFETALEEERDEGWRRLIRQELDHLRRLRSVRSWSEARPRLLDAAQRNDRPVVEQMVKQWTLAARDELEEEVLGAWGESIDEGRVTEAERQMRIARSISEALARLGDRFVTDALPKGEALAAAHRSYRDARRAQVRGSFEEAEKLARLAGWKFRQAGSPFTELADRVVATCLYQHGDLENALAGSERALAAPTVQRYPSVAGRWLWLKGISLVGRGQPAEALEAYSQARSRFETMGDSEGIALSETFMAETLNYLGQTREVAQRLTNAMRLSGEVAGRSRLEIIPSEFATFCARQDLLRAALAFQDLAVRQARASGLGYTEGYALMERSRLQLRAGAQKAAAADTARARLLWTRTTPGALRDRMLADLEVAEGRLLLASDPRAAAKRFEGALSYFEGVGRTFQPLVVRYLLARALLAAGRSEEAKSSLERGLSSRESLRAVLRSESQRESFFDEAQAFFDDLFELAFHRGDMAAAFDAAERSRSRVLLDRLAGDAPLAAVVVTPPPLAEIQRRLPADAALVEFHVDSRQVRAIFIGRSEVAGKDLVPRQRVTLALAALARGRRGGDSYEAELALLYDLLLRPFAAHLQKVRSLVLVPHRELFGLPFAALYDRKTKRFLLEEITLTLAPSAAVALPATSPSSPAQMPTALVFADPQIDERDSHSALSSLPGARVEGVAVARQYKKAVIRQGASARVSTFLREAGQFDVVHVATHGRENPAKPGLSFLAFARGEGDATGILTAEEIADTRFPRTKLVVLAACRGASGVASGSEGAVSVARAFLAAGVPSVVASLADLDDQAAASLFSAFHRHYVTGESPAEALRQAQLEQLQSADPSKRSPLVWGSVQLIGRAKADFKRR